MLYSILMKEQLKKINSNLVPQVIERALGIQAGIMAYKKASEDKDSNLNLSERILAAAFLGFCQFSFPSIVESGINADSDGVIPTIFKQDKPSVQSAVAVIDALSFLIPVAVVGMGDSFAIAGTAKGIYNLGIGAINEISERKQIERALRPTRTFYK